jgi:hypothetical protein
MRYGWRLFSNMEDAIAYFSFCPAFRRGSNSGVRA